MIQIMKHKFWYLILSAVLLVPGIISLGVYKLNLAIDFTGGSVFEYSFNATPNSDELKKIFEAKGAHVENITIEDTKAIVKTRPVETQQIETITKELIEKFPEAKQLAVETVGPSIGLETTKNAFVSLFWASVGILFYIAYAFRNIPAPYSSFRFGASALLAMLHDAVMVLGVFSILGHFLKIEVDALFITALLTVIGFSVHDTIVVFDRIRENLLKLPKHFSFEYVVNYSVVETLNRSLATSLTVVITLLALFLLGGASIKTFVLAMLIGIISGTYSSIFTASPILVYWENFAAQLKLKTIKKK
jgi:preprotein translocase subunit SecF